jgi:tellurite resistance protein TerC
VLVFVGIKMMAVDLYKLPIEWSLLFIATVITGSILLSLKLKKNPNPMQ